MSKSTLNSLEQMVLEAVLRDVAEPHRSLLQQQAHSVAFVQRICRGRESNLYYIRRGIANRFRKKSITLPAPVAQCIGKECHLAKVSILNKEWGVMHQCDVWVVDGYLFTFEFDCDALDIDASELRIDGVTIDPSWS